MTPNKDLLYGILGTIALYQKAEAQRGCGQLHEQVGAAGADSVPEEPEQQ